MVIAYSLLTAIRGKHIFISFNRNKSNFLLHLYEIYSKYLSDTVKQWKNRKSRWQFECPRERIVNKLLIVLRLFDIKTEPTMQNVE